MPKNYENGNKNIFCLSVVLESKVEMPPPPLFGRSVNSISIRGGGAHYPHSVLRAPGISDLATALLCNLELELESKLTKRYDLLLHLLGFFVMNGREGRPSKNVKMMDTCSNQKPGHNHNGLPSCIFFCRPMTQYEKFFTYLQL